MQHLQHSHWKSGLQTCTMAWEQLVPRFAQVIRRRLLVDDFFDDREEEVIRNFTAIASGLLEDFVQNPSGMSWFLAVLQLQPWATFHIQPILDPEQYPADQHEILTEFGLVLNEELPHESILLSQAAAMFAPW
mmetsp:Transcript_35449/g.64951  ORF Transcript_35449/g.64951 Transcript_35449/m.64951 type:complete len:133 (-) Transcript_35449:164-562(-)